MSGTVLTTPPRPAFDVPRLDRCRTRARAGPRPAAGTIASPVTPKVRMVGETILSVGPNAFELTNSSSAVSEGVLQTMLFAGQLDQLDAADTRRRERDAVGRCCFARVHDQRCAAGRGTNCSDRPG